MLTTVFFVPETFLKANNKNNDRSTTFNLTDAFLKAFTK